MTLRAKVFRGGAFLALRETLGMGISLVGVVLLTRAIGPSLYGLFAAALGVFTYAQNLSLWGINVYLLRHSEPDTPGAVYPQAISLLLLLGGICSGLGLLGVGVISRAIGLPDIEQLLRVLLLALPGVLVAQVPLAKLEKELDYRRVALIDLIGRGIYYVVALPAAYTGAGAWAPLFGWLAQQSFGLVAYFWSAHLRPSLAWHWPLAKRMLTYGLSFSSSIWVWQLRSLVNPLIVGRFVGAAGVGYVALAIRLSEMISFVKSATWRLSIAALAHLRGDCSRLCSALCEGMRLQILAIGPLLVGFVILGSPVALRLFGPRWGPMLRVFPFIALSYLTNAMFNLHSAVLYVSQRNWRVTKFHVVHVALFAGSAWFLVQSFGVLGYGLAELVAIVSYFVIDREVRLLDVRPKYGLAVAWWFSFSLALFWRDLGWIAVAGLAITALMPATWKELMAIVDQLQGATRAA